MPETLLIGVGAALVGSSGAPALVTGGVIGDGSEGVHQMAKFVIGVVQRAKGRLGGEK